MAFTSGFRIGPFLLASALAIVSVSQQPEVQGVPTFRGTARLVVVDVVVTNHDGEPVTDIPANDFTVLEDGVPQSIASFESPAMHPSTPVFFDRDSSVRDERGPRTSAPASTPSALTIIVLDELNSEVLDQAYARFSIQEYLHTHGPRLQQPTSLMILGEKRLELVHDYTQDAAALVEALHHRHAELPFGLMTAELNGSGERMAKTLWALQQIAVANNHFTGRKNVIWIGPGFPAISTPLVLDPKDRKKFVTAVSEAASLLLDARVAVYTVDPRGLEVAPPAVSMATGSSSPELSGFMTATADPASGDLVFEAIAPETGGKVFPLRNDVAVAIATSAADGAAYYALAYYPTNHDWNGKFRGIQVKLRQQNLQARSRRGYFAIPDALPSDKEIDTLLSRAVMNPLPYRALTVSASAKAVGAQSARFTIKVDRHSLQWATLPDGNRRCEVTVVVASVGAGDKVYNHKVTELESVVDAKDFQSQWDEPVAFSLVSAMPPNTRHVRIVVRDAQSGYAGTADLPRHSLPLR